MTGKSVQQRKDLTEQQSAIVQLREIKKLRVSEIAEELGIEPGNVYRTLRNEHVKQAVTELREARLDALEGDTLAMLEISLPNASVTEQIKLLRQLQQRKAERSEGDPRATFNIVLPTGGTVRAVGGGVELEASSSVGDGVGDAPGPVATHDTSDSQ